VLGPYGGTYTPTHHLTGDEVALRFDEVVIKWPYLTLHRFLRDAPQAVRGSKAYTVGRIRLLATRGMPYVRSVLATGHVQGYLAHAETPTTLGLP
jgi:hypothetical protein